MKKRTILLLPLVLFALQLSFAQITEENKSMSLGLQNALVLELPNTSLKFVEKLWKKRLKEFGGKTKKLKKSELFTDDAKISALGGANTLDLYCRLSDAGSSVFLNMWVDLGGAFLSSSEHPEKYIEAEKILMRFALDVAKETTRLEMLGEEKTLNKIENELKRLERDNERYHRDIELAKERIIKAEESIKTNEIEQENTQIEIEQQQEVLKEVQLRYEDF